jgi:hypothetical protein
MICPQCQASNPDDAGFCRNCRRELAPLQVRFKAPGVVPPRAGGNDRTATQAGSNETVTGPRASLGTPTQNGPRETHPARREDARAEALGPPGETAVAMLFVAMFAGGFTNTFLAFMAKVIDGTAPGDYAWRLLALFCLAAGLVFFFFNRRSCFWRENEARAAIIDRKLFAMAVPTLVIMSGIWTYVIVTSVPDGITAGKQVWMAIQICLVIYFGYLYVSTRGTAS